ncbi:MAG: hypothetical protein AAF635_09080 [Cyanobacteria bacterium P01_C01_bin.69]
MNSLDAIVADQYLGNTHESKEIALQISQAQAQQLCLEVAIARQDCGKGRIFTQTEAQQPIGIVKERTWRLRDGDVLCAQSGQLVLVSLQKQPVIALQFERKALNVPVNLMRLGHIVGNHHWPMALKEETLYVEVANNADVIESTLREAAKSLNIKGLHIVREYKTAEQALDFVADLSGAHSHVH